MFNCGDRGFEMIEGVCGEIEFPPLFRSFEETLFPYMTVTTRTERYPKIKKVIFNGKTTIIFWNDHTKTVVKCQDGDTFFEEAGIALCFMKKMLGNKGNYNKVLREVLEKAKRQVKD